MRGFDEGVDAAKTLKDLCGKFSGSSPSYIVWSLAAHYEDGICKQLSMEDLIGAGLAEETVFDELFLEEYAKKKMQESKELGNSIMNPRFHSSKEQIIEQFKTENKYKWKE